MRTLSCVLEVFTFFVKLSYFIVLYLVMDTQSLSRCKSHYLNAVAVSWTLFKFSNDLGHLAVCSGAKDYLLFKLLRWLLKLLSEGSLGVVRDLLEHLLLFIFVAVVGQTVSFIIKLRLVDCFALQDIAFCIFYVFSGQVAINSLFLFVLNGAVVLKTESVEPIGSRAPDTELVCEETTEH